MKSPFPRSLKALCLLPFLFFGGLFPLYPQEAGGGAGAIPGGAAPTAAESPGETAAESPDGALAEGADGALAEAADEAGAEAADEASAEDKAAAAANSILEMDIRTSTLAELASWCRSLGLSEGGGKEELAGRLRRHFGLAPPAQEAAEGSSDKKVITIESARSTEYFTLDVVDEEYARLRGDVIVSLKDGEAVHRISAWEILYNRTRNTMSASGGVVYIKEEGDTRETFRGESITVNLDDWSTVFMDGVSERSLASDNTTYRFAGTLITRSDEDVTVLTRAEISNASNEEALWSLSASKLWLLPGSDWAVLNAVLKVGQIPVLWIPAFFFPADEILFHPVVGYRSREGNFVQTTTYILGRPKAAATSESSISKILGNSADNEKVREGLFLRSTGRKSRDPNDTRLSVLFDGYANLGAYLGTELALPAKGIFGALDLSLGLGLTRNIYLIGSSYYTPFEQSDGVSEWNSSRFFSIPIPLRYRLNTSGSLSGAYGSLSWGFPFYADPYVDRDFLNRSEEMDWFGMLEDSSSSTQLASTTETILGPYEWRLSGSISPKVGFLSPFVTSLSVSSLSSTVAFRTRNSTLRTDNASPERVFFFPDKFTIASITAAIAGTPLTLGGAKTASASSTPAAGSASAAGSAAAAEGEGPLRHIGIPRSPWETPAEEKTAPPGSDPYSLSPPALSQRFDFLQGGGPKFTIDYRFSPSLASELQFRSSQQNWPEIEEIDWGEISSILSTFRTDGSLTFALTEPNTALYASSLRLFGNASWQDYSLINEGAEEFDTPAKVDAARLRVNNATFYTTSSEFITTIKPLYWDPVWGGSNLQYTLRGLMVKSVFDGTKPEPAWDTVYGKWDKEDLDAHQVAANIAASVMDKTQNFSLVAEIPPEEPTLSGDLTLRAWISETNVKQKILNPYEDPSFDPFSFTETLRFATGYSAQQSVVYDPKLEEFTNLNSSLTLGGFSASFSAARIRTYFLEPGQGWLLSPDPEKLNPRDFRLAYSRSFKQENLWYRRLSFQVNLNTSLSFDLQRYTYSRFNFSLGFTLGLAKFLDLSFSATSENSVVFRYFQDLPFFQLDADLPGEKNLFTDLLNSFRFDDESLRKSSGFKLKSFNLAITHYLGDWNAKFGVTLSPYLDQTTFPYQYKFNNQISFLIQWIPISEIKTEIIYDKDAFVRKQ
jgi:lipopolysaccharide assembly outer membrane protein LptD (OstA)